MGRRLVSDQSYWLGFGLIPGIGPVRVRRLLDYFGDLESAWSAPSAELSRAGLDQRAVEALTSRRGRIDLEAESSKLARLGVALVTLDDPSYPERLRQIYGPPIVLFVRGELRPTDDLAIAIVGTRRASPYGRQAAERISTDLVTGGATIVSGLARGIDTCAHRAALDAGGRTIAVLGCGVDVNYPAENARLSGEIVERGAIVSEYPLGTPPDAANFPARNRIVSGLTRGTVVVEAGETSGALITARFAADQGREVFAVPGGIFSPQSRGTNRLIQEGAKLLTSGRDVLDELHLETVGRQLELRDLLPADEVERAILRLLGPEPRHVDDITRASDLSAAQVGATLTMLEIKGLARHVGGMSYVAT
jgi:DNA processing protein